MDSSVETLNTSSSLPLDSCPDIALDGDDILNIDQTSDSVWHNFLVNLTSTTDASSSEHSPMTDSVGSEKKASSGANSLNLALSGDCDLENESEQGCSKWYQFGDDDMIKPTSPDQPLSSVSAGEQSHLGRFAVHTLNASRLRVVSRFRKSWGNFTNIFDADGRQKICIDQTELSNYMVLRSAEVSAEKSAPPETSNVKFLVSLFTGNYPKPLFRSTWSWRMRWNVFVAGLSEQMLCTLQSTIDQHQSSSPIEAEGEEEGQEQDDNQIYLEQLGLLPPRLSCEQVHQSQSMSASVGHNVDKLVHLGEMHLYFHVERGSPLEPVYQNLCFFFDPSLVQLLKHLPVLSGTSFINWTYQRLPQLIILALGSFPNYINLLCRTLPCYRFFPP